MIKNENYCYLDDAIKMPFIPELYNAEDDKVGDVDYQDPDAFSERLYCDLEKAMNSSNHTDINLQYEFKNINGRLNLVDQHGRHYSSDFIGPSRYWAKIAGISDQKIGEYLKRARIITGHVAWPLNGTCQTINTQRGGEKGVYDRIDLTLAELRNYFTGESCWFSSRLRAVFEKESDWLDIFRAENEDGLTAFKRLIDYMKLNDFVFGDDYQVISLVCSNLQNKEIVAVSKDEPAFPGNIENLTFAKIKELRVHNSLLAGNIEKEYNKFIANSVYAIEARNRR